jgi:hypothetical protein
MALPHEQAQPLSTLIMAGGSGWEGGNEFGKLIKLQEAENQIVIDYEVYDQCPNDTTLLIPAIEMHEAVLERTPRLVASDAGFYFAKNEAANSAEGLPSHPPLRTARAQPHQGRYAGAGA